MHFSTFKFPFRNLKTLFPPSTLSLQILGFSVFLACTVKETEIDTAGFPRKERQFNIAMWCRKLSSTSGAPPGSGVSWGPGVPGAAEVSGISSWHKEIPGAQSLSFKRDALMQRDVFVIYSVTSLLPASSTAVLFIFFQDSVTLINCSLLKYCINISISLLFLVCWRELLQNLTQFVSWLAIL